MRCAIAIWLVAAAAAADVILGPLKTFAAPPPMTYSVVALVPRESGVAAFLLGRDRTLYVQHLGQAPGRAALANVDGAAISNGKIAYQSAGTIFTAPLLDDDSIDLGAAHVLANGNLVTFGCNDTRCLVQWKEGSAYVAQITGGVPPTLDGAAQVLAVDPGGFLLSRRQVASRQQ